MLYSEELDGSINRCYDNDDELLTCCLLPIDMFMFQVEEPPTAKRRTPYISGPIPPIA